MKTPVDITVTGAAGQISYSLLFRLAGGLFWGRINRLYCGCWKCLRQWMR